MVLVIPAIKYLGNVLLLRNPLMFSISNNAKKLIINIDFQDSVDEITKSYILVKRNIMICILKQLYAKLGL